MVDTLLCEQLWIACHDFHPTHIFLSFLILKQSILQDEGPNVVAESVGVQMSLQGAIGQTFKLPSASHSNLT